MKNTFEISSNLFKPKEAEKRAVNRTYLPFGLDIKGFKCLVVGGGRIALRKINSLLKTQSYIKVVAPEVCSQIEFLSQEGKLEWVKDKYNSSYLYDSDIVISATSNRKLNIIIGKEAKSAAKLHCVTSSAKDSNLIFPAVCKHHDVVVAVHSNGKNCTKSKYTRDSISELLNEQKRQTLLLIGVYYKNLEPSIAASLDSFTKNYSGKIYPDKCALITTCQRWECFICADNPAEIFRSLGELIEQTCGIKVSDFSRNLYSKEDLSAFHHLLRLYTGLDSLLFGENDIVAQINSAIKNWLPEQSALRTIFTQAAAKSKAIRRRCKITGVKSVWQKAVAVFLRKKAFADEKIIVCGSGKFAKSVYNHLKAEYQNIYNSIELSDADILILCDEKSMTRLYAASFDIKHKTIINLTRCNPKDIISSCSNYFDLTDIADSFITAETAEKKAKAEIEALEQALLSRTAAVKSIMPNRVINIAARDSRLSLLQVQEVLHLLRALSPELKIETAPYSSPGDRDKTTPLTKIEQQDFFTADIDLALMSYEIDLAVHSAKDLPQKLHNGLHIAAITPPLAPWDCLVTRSGKCLAELPSQSVVGTSSARRASHILAFREDLHIADIRGNISDRLAQLDCGKYDAVIVASVALIRLGLTDRITEIFPLSLFDVEKGQGSLALVTRKSDNELNNFLKPLDLGEL